MAFFANLLVLKNYNIRISIVYLLILSSLLLGYYVTFLDLTNIPSFLLKILFPAILTVPIFSRIAFSKQLSKKFVGIALSSNILGAIFGSLLEYNSMYFGFRSLYLLGFAMYFLAYLLHIKDLSYKTN